MCDFFPFADQLHTLGRRFLGQIWCIGQLLQCLADLGTLEGIQSDREMSKAPQKHCDPTVCGGPVFAGFLQPCVEDFQASIFHKSREGLRIHAVPYCEDNVHAGLDRRCELFIGDHFDVSRHVANGGFDLPRFGVWCSSHRGSRSGDGSRSRRRGGLLVLIYVAGKEARDG